MKNIYLTSTFTNEWNVEFNPKIGEALEKRGITCYLPHRDTNQKEENKLKIVAQDITGIDNSSIILAVALNESPNWGAEFGYAYGIKKPILVLTNKEHNIPLICEGMTTEIIQVENLDKIEEYIELLSNKIKTILSL
ncbi:MAG: nucleoside 2-deoxyribosyltransferase [Candidatus Paceibacterota bacterium]